MAHHYHDFFMTYDRPREPAKEKEASGSVKQEKTENEKENKETECSNMIK